MPEVAPLSTKEGSGVSMGQILTNEVELKQETVFQDGRRRKRKKFDPRVHERNQRSPSEFPKHTHQRGKGATLFLKFEL